LTVSVNIDPLHDAAGGLCGAIDVSRCLTAELSPPILQEGGLQAGLEWLMRWMRDKYALHVELVMGDGAPVLSPDLTALLFESLRELLFNTVSMLVLYRQARLEAALACSASEKGSSWWVERWRLMRRRGRAPALF
jgi:hypothetical protein